MTPSAPSAASVTIDLGQIKIPRRPEWNRRFDRADDADGADAEYPTAYAPSSRTVICAVGHSCCRRAYGENRKTRSAASWQRRSVFAA
jgi:hypothetical protein